MAPADPCRIPPPGWVCSREAHHEGPCAARPTVDPDSFGHAELILERARADQKRHSPSHRSMEGRLSEHNLGGRSLDDAEQLAATLYHTAKEVYAINEVPAELLQDLTLLRRLGAEFTQAAERILTQLNRERGYAA